MTRTRHSNKEAKDEMMILRWGKTKFGWRELPNLTNDRYRSFLAYMEEKREEARVRLKEDEDRKDAARKKEESWELMKEAVRFLKEKKDGWRERRIEECERIREEEKKDRLALVKEKKKRYGLKRLSKEENSRLKSRTEERLLVSQAKANLWKRYRDGDDEEDGSEMGAEEETAWRNILDGVKELEEEDGAWRTPEKEVARMSESRLKYVLGGKDGKTMTDREGDGGIGIGVRVEGDGRRWTESLPSRGGHGQMGSL